LARAAVAAGLVTGVGVASQLAVSDWGRPSQPASAARRGEPALSRPPVSGAVRPGGGPTTAEPLDQLRVARLQDRELPIDPPVTAPIVPRPATAPLVAPSGARPSTPRADARSRLERPRSASEIPSTTPFAAVLGTILYAPDRKLAIVDGRIVQAGDDVNGARIVDITPTAVLLRDGEGRLRRLTLGAPRTQ
jgi:hypothetical protein